MEALQERMTLTELSKHHAIHPTLIIQWKKTFIEQGVRLFQDVHPEKEDYSELIETLYHEIGDLWSAKKYKIQNVKIISVIFLAKIKGMRYSLQEKWLIHDIFSTHLEESLDASNRWLVSTCQSDAMGQDRKDIQQDTPQRA
jgi:hypothetical protein